VRTARHVCRPRRSQAAAPGPLSLDRPNNALEEELDGVVRNSMPVPFMVRTLVTISLVASEMCRTPEPP
jgi:hypothetical protein